jgi:5-methylcytosine-specific restriction endonuclease McrA
MTDFESEPGAGTFEEAQPRTHCAPAAPKRTAVGESTLRDTRRAMKNGLRPVISRVALPLRLATRGGGAQLNASSALKEKLELSRPWSATPFQNGDVAAVLERALDLALEQVQKRRFAKTDKPRRKPGGMKSRSRGSHREHIPNAVQREVATRDRLHCTYVSDDGCRCSARAFLQLHHEEPWARGGASNAENLRTLCAVHNRLLAERDFGAAHVAARLAARRGNDARATDSEAVTRDMQREVSEGP